jgi:signal transduction histidine kinase
VGLTVSSDENYLRVIMQNLMSNAIKAVTDTANGTIEWSVKGKEINRFSITDTGLASMMNN